MNHNYTEIRKGLQKEVLFLGLKAKYINYCIYIGVGVIAFGLGLSLLIPTSLALLVTTGMVGCVFVILLFYSRTYGANGFIKKIADNSKPQQVKVSGSFSKMVLWERR
ncbi:DUF4133 domain-containing protein [Hyunsoonleella pacifica]|uniref:DUF4133 domain-containing protein n=1 Tax=Hyunsoonleella pacifica TaxID=1080224 RepID=A0A4Q9FP10_9FLAO|nr:DUF4133 domain-containing protein [Hyunsoonleella pacifica]TBN14389.1 DUF4133 domain-containing protein [Hyunsoonleella pacifica]GGD13358.1 hypothetical protein GCM10011368_14150 [Hyunsoonleella pacifica]